MKGKPVVIEIKDTGLKDIDRAPKGARARCMVCDDKIVQGSWRLLYRHKTGLGMSGLRYIHQHDRCVSALPDESRIRDIAFAERMIAQNVLDAAIV